MKQFNIIAENTEGQIIFRESMEEAMKVTTYGKIKNVEEMEMKFYSCIRFKDGINKDVYHKRMMDLTELILKAHPFYTKVNFEPSGIYLSNKKNLIAKVYHAKTGRDVLNFIDGYWETIGLQLTIKQNQ